MTRVLAAAALVSLVGGSAVAHEGHEHKVMGTISAVQEHQLEIKGAKDGKLSTVTLDEKTKIVRDRKPATLAEVKPGDRVVVTAVTQKDKAGKEVLIAKEIRLGTASGAGATP